jgi:hypothetical protein
MNFVTHAEWLLTYLLFMRFWINLFTLDVWML